MMSTNRSGIRVVDQLGDPPAVGALDPDALGEALSTIASLLSEKGYCVRVFSPNLVYRPEAQPELEALVEWFPDKVLQPQISRAFVSPSGLEKAMIYFQRIPSARAAQILSPK